MKELLKKYFGYNEFRAQQEEIIHSVLEKNDTLVLMPTGGGKSLCYQIPALHFEGLTIVISPLISLMKDQVDALQMNGIKAESLNSTLSKTESKEIELRIKNKELTLLYIAPERLFLKEFREFISKVKVSLLAIDEAHCISQWGHDFRKEYGKLKQLKELFPQTPIIALTATATKEVKEDIIKQLRLEPVNIFSSTFDRDNLELILRDKKNYVPQILALLEKNKENSTIIYSHSRNDCETLVSQLQSYGFKALVYHAGISTKRRDLNQELFLKAKVNIIVATIAFGMGIDKSNVRLIIHTTFSNSLESYYQEIGRAGRDGIESKCVLFYSQSDKRKHEYFINKIYNQKLRINANTKLAEIVSYCEGRICRRKYLLNYFGEEYTKENCGNCDICLNLPQSIHIDKIPQKLNSSYNEKFLEELKTLRQSLADERDRVPELIFNDVSLKEMARKLPSTDEDFLKITGVVKQKLDEFGEEFLMLINEEREVQQISKRLETFDGIREEEEALSKAKTKYKVKYKKKYSSKYKRKFRKK